jgi:hypothetical protein
MIRLWPVTAFTIAVAAVACLSVSSSVAQQGKDELASGLATVPACVNNKDEAIRFVNRNRGRSDLAVGMATRDADGNPTVVRSNFAAAPLEFQQFIDRHECAHHQTGDVDRPHPPRNSSEHLMIESIADCVAIRRLRDEEGFDNTSLEVIASALRTDMKKIGFPDISITSRIRNISGCFENPSTAGDLVDQVLKQRGLRQ